MKILYLTNENYFKNPIIDSQVITLINEIHSKESEIFFDLITFDTDNRIDSFQNKKKNYRHIFLKDYHHIINIISLIYFCIKKGKNYDIIHVRSFPGMFGAIIAKLFYRTKIVFDPRGLYAEEFSYLENRFFLTKIFKFFEPFFCKYANIIVVVSQPFKKYYQKEYYIQDNKIIVIPTFAILKENRDDKQVIINVKKDYFKNENCLLFIYSGSIETWQNIDKVINFFSLLSKEIDNAKFAVFSKDAARFEELLKNCLQRNSFFVKSLSKDEIPYYLSQADYGLLLRDNNIINIVSSPIKVKDYLLAGVPIILTNNIGDSSNYIQVNKFGYILEGLDDNDMLNVINQIKNEKYLFDKEWIRLKSTNDFSVGNIADEYINIYNNFKL